MLSCFNSRLLTGHQLNAPNITYLIYFVDNYSFLTFAFKCSGIWRKVHKSKAKTSGDIQYNKTDSSAIFIAEESVLPSLVYY